MHMLINIQDVEARFARLKLQPSDIAELAGIHRTTWHRAVRGDVELRGKNLRAVATALVSAEKSLLEHLIQLHPETARELLNGTGGEGGSVASARPAGSSPEEEAA